MERKRATAIEEAPPDAFQQEVREIVGDERAWASALAGDPDGVAAERRRQIEQLFDGAEVVDLVGHSTPINRYLKLGDWVLDPDEAERFASYLPPCVKTVRVIGCTTACTDAGRRAIEAFTRDGRAAFGTLNKVYTSHFDKDGVKRGGGGPPLAPVLRGTTQALVRTQPAAGTARTYAPSVVLRPSQRRLLRRAGATLAKPVTSLFATLRWAVKSALARHVTHRRILRLLSPLATSMPGLLTEPLLTYSVHSRGKEYRLEILYDFEYARFYAVDGAGKKRDYVFRIRGFGKVAKTLLELYLELAPKGVKLLSRHPEAGDRGGPG